MSDNDFFDRTIIQSLPSTPTSPAGSDEGKSADTNFYGANTPNQQTSSFSNGTASHPNICYERTADTNPILGHCTPLICYMAEFKNIPTIEDSGELFSYCASEIKSITEGLRQEGVDEKIINTARYMICGYIDEIVFNTPWGVNSQWVTQSLLSYFYKEVNAGEKFFKIIDTLLEKPAAYIDILDLAHTLLSLGYMGKYRSQANGASTLREIKHSIFSTSRSLRQDVGSRLSNTRSAPANLGRTFAQKKLIWPVAGICALLCTSVFSLYLFKLNKLSDPIAIRSSALASNLAPILEIKRAPPKVTSSVAAWRESVATDLLDKKLSIQKIPEGFKFALTGENLFSSGASSLRDFVVLDSIVEVLKKHPGSLRITGHTDNIPIRSVRFPSNWQLSQARADAVANHIRKSIPDIPLHAEGMADSQPLVNNNSKANRSKNRRVEISIYP